MNIQRDNSVIRFHWHIIIINQHYLETAINSISSKIPIYIFLPAKDNNFLWISHPYSQKKLFLFFIKLAKVSIVLKWTVIFFLVFQKTEEKAVIFKSEICEEILLFCSNYQMKFSSFQVPSTTNLLIIIKRQEVFVQ